jgi:hypothetical protein
MRTHMCLEAQEMRDVNFLRHNIFCGVFFLVHYVVYLLLFFLLYFFFGANILKIKG